MDFDVKKDSHVDTASVSRHPLPSFQTKNREDEMAKERLQKVIAQAGLASRRKAEQFIVDGAVRVNGRIVKELGTKVDPKTDKVEVHGKALIIPKRWTYVLLNKPMGVVTTAQDEFQRKTVLELVNEVQARLFPVGRLDMDAEGVLLMTNDGDLAAALTHPAGQVPKTYLAKVSGKVTDQAIERLEAGVVLEDGFARAWDVRRTTVGHKPSPKNSWIELTVMEGRNHMIKRMCDSVGFPVLRLRRLLFAGLSADRIRIGGWRHLSKQELQKLKELGQSAKRRRKDQQAGL